MGAFGAQARYHHTRLSMFDVQGRGLGVGLERMKVPEPHTSLIGQHGGFRHMIPTTAKLIAVDERELAEMLANGRWEIQSHGSHDHDLHDIDAVGTKNHFLSNRLWLSDAKRLENEAEFKARIEQDLVVSKSDIEQVFGNEVHSFAFPFGDYGQGNMNFPDAEQIIKEVIQKTYDYAFYQQYLGGSYTQNYAHNKTNYAKRINVLPEWSGSDLVHVLDQGIAR